MLFRSDPKLAPTAGLPNIEDAVKAGSWLCGPPERIIERLMELQDKYPGLKGVHVGCTRIGTPLDVMLEQLERFALEVMPKFKKQARSEEHTSELQSRRNLVCRLLLEKKKHDTTAFTPTPVT